MARDWDDHYRTEQRPWDTGVVEPLLEAFVRDASLSPRRVLEVGCGTGTNALWLAEAGFDVVALDLSPTAIELARAKAASQAAKPQFLVRDFLAEPVEGRFDLVFDRGVFHVFDDPADRAMFAARVAGLLAPEGVWYSLIGSTEGPPRSGGPPRRSARDVVEAIEPVLEIASIEAKGFRDHGAMAWACLSRLRKTYTAG
jgi:SAM-dependent methyltransferase